MGLFLDSIMAGDWIKVEHVTPDKPEVWAMAERLGIDADAVVGKLVRIWIWADQQTHDGNARSVTKALLNRVSGVTGFAEAMINVGWLKAEEAGLVFTNFDRHNGHTAKKRSLSAKRVETHRASNATVTPEALQQRYKSVTREEKRREEVDSSNTETQEPQGTAKPARVCFRKPNAQDVAEYATGICANVDPQEFIDHYTSNGWKVGKAPMKDWKAAVRNWAKRDLNGKAKTDAAVRAGFTRQAQQDAQWDAFREFERLAAQDDELDRQELVAGSQDGSKGRGAGNHAALLGKGPGPNDPF